MGSGPGLAPASAELGARPFAPLAATHGGRAPARSAARLRAELATAAKAAKPYLLTSARSRAFQDDLGRFVGRPIRPAANMRIAPAFEVYPRERFPAHVQAVLTSIDRLSNSQCLREKVFGHVSYGRVKTSDLPPGEVLALHGEMDSPFVEVGAIVVALADGGHLTRFVTSAQRNAIDGFGEVVGLLEEAGWPEGATSVSFFHSHPLNLYLSLDDQASYLAEHDELRDTAPEAFLATPAGDRANWRMYSQMPDDPFLMGARLADWAPRRK